VGHETDRQPEDAAAPASSASPTPGNQAVASTFTRAELQRRAVHGTLWTGLQTVLVLVLGFGANVVVSRALGPVAFGRLALLSTVFSLTGAAAGAGVAWGVVQWGVEAWSAGKADETAQLFARAAGWRLLVQLPVNVAVGVLLLHRSAPWVVVAFVVVTVVGSALDTATLGLTVTQRTAVGARVAIVASTVSQIAGVVVALTTPTASGVWVARYAAGVIGPLVVVTLIDPALRRGVLHPRLPRGMPAGFWRFALQFAGSGLLGLLVFNRSEVLVLALYGQHRGLGIYALAYGLAAHLTAPVDAAALPLVAGLGGLLATAPELIGAGLLRAERLVALVSGALMALAVPALVLLVPLVYGASYRGAATLVAVLAIVSTLRVLKHPVDAVLNSRRQSRVLLRANMTSFAVDAVVAFGAIAVVGVWGAVAATGAAQAVSIGLQARGEVGLGAVRWRQLIGSCWSWLVGIGCGAISLGVGALLVAPCTRVGAAAVTVVVSALLLGLARVLLGPALHRGDGGPVVSGLPRPLRPLAARGLSWAGDTDLRPTTPGQV